MNFKLFNVQKKNNKTQNKTKQQQQQKLCHYLE